MRESVCILGSTGSIGTSTLDVIERNSQKYSVEVLTAHSNHELLLEQCKRFNPKLVVLVDETAGKTLKTQLTECELDIEVETGSEALNEAANYPGLNTVVAAIVGAAGLLPTLTAVKQGCKVLLANKEALVMSGNIFTEAVKQYGATLLPVDSEHNAIFQCLHGAGLGQENLLQGVHKILLTGSGGPFRTIPLQDLQTVTPEQACAHPNWDMGKKISVDSATMMNKGLELIEACFLFETDINKIDIVVHPQSIVHSMVSYHDGSVLAQM
ncbi:MAG: 1-deoxy-D-xylulose-5-phosphate reductoisomerase, partial [Kangiellaceae bacterium]|nr:1-deoxy-D-xylulose-5-phosphate reductoisomerase [Kangiellaceae bacterium]